MVRNEYTTLRRLNIALIPPTQTARQLFDLAARTVPDGSVFRIGEAVRAVAPLQRQASGYSRLGLARWGPAGARRARRQPHLTLYMGDFPATPETSLLLRRRLEPALQGFASIDCWATALSLTDDGYIEVAYSKTRDLTNLQDTVVQAVEDLARPVTELPAHTGMSLDRIESLRQHKH